ncbi:MAG: hypothetical protein CSA76_02355 [Spirochaetales bacterium]|nr:MAG: hypothetical protein CSA76_02355 [Spirochaetales bacterium]
MTHSWEFYIIIRFIAECPDRVFWQRIDSYAQILHKICIDCKWLFGDNYTQKMFFSDVEEVK